MSKFIARTVDVIFLLFAALCLFCMSLSGGRIIFGDYRIYVLAAMMLFVCLMFLLFGSDIVRFLKEKLMRPLQNASAGKLAIIIGLVTLVTKLLFVYLFENDANLHPDMQRYLSFANQIAKDGKISEYVWYAYRHKRTAIFGMILSPFAKLLGGDTQALTAGLTLGVAIASILLFDIVRKHTGNTIAFLGIMIYNLMPFGLFQTQLLVHETALLFFHILSFWLLLKASEEKYPIWLKILLLVLSGLSISIGRSINPAGAVVIIAMIIFTFARIVREKITLKGLVSFVSFLLIFLVAVSAGKTLLNAAVTPMIPEDHTYQDIAAKKVKNGWTIYLAFNPEQYGVWNQEDYDTYYAYEQIEDVEEARAYQVNLVKERLSLYKENPLKLIELFYNKFYILWGDLWMSFQYQQGNHLESFVYKGAGSLIYTGLYLLSVFFNLIAMTTILFANSKHKYKDRDRLVLPSMHFKMVILGVTVALLFAEVMSKYTSHLVILVYVIWMYELKDFCKTSNFLKGKLFKKRKKPSTNNTPCQS